MESPFPTQFKVDAAATYASSAPQAPGGGNNSHMRLSRLLLLLLFLGPLAAKELALLPLDCDLLLLLL